MGKVKRETVLKREKKLIHQWDGLIDLQKQTIEDYKKQKNCLMIVGVVSLYVPLWLMTVFLKQGTKLLVLKAIVSQFTKLAGWWNDGKKEHKWSRDHR